MSDRRQTATSVFERRAVTIAARDGVPLSALILAPPRPRGVVQINAATGAKRSFYLPLAEYLAESGLAACVWDYRGMGEATKPGALKNCDYRFSDYGLKDMPAVLDHLTREFPGLPVTALGHSVGAQLIGLMDNVSKLAGLVAVASSGGYWGYMPRGYALKTLFYFHVLSPLSQAVFGYNATKRIGVMEDLPSGVVAEWGEWCSRPDYLFDERFFGKTIPRGHYHELGFPIKVLWASDDPIANARSVPRFWQHVKSDKGLDIERIDAKALGLGEIGHFGFFRRQFKDTLWPRALAAIRTV